MSTLPVIISIVCFIKLPTPYITIKLYFIETKIYKSKALEKVKISPKSKNYNLQSNFTIRHRCQIADIFPLIFRTHSALLGHPLISAYR